MITDIKLDRCEISGDLAIFFTFAGEVWLEWIGEDGRTEKRDSQLRTAMPAPSELITSIHRDLDRWISFNKAAMDREAGECDGGPWAGIVHDGNPTGYGSAEY